MLCSSACGWFDGPLVWPGLEPLDEENRAPVPWSPSDPYPETLELASGDAGDYEWVHARGWIKAPVGDVWDVLRDPDVLIDRRRVAEWRHEYDEDPDVPVSFVTHHLIRDVITLRFSTVWKQAHLEGTEDEPKGVCGRGELAESSMFISLLRTTFLLEAARPDVTEIQFMRHLDAFAAGAEDAEQYLWDLFETVVARVRGEPLPEW